MIETKWAEIDLDCLSHNVKEIRKRVGEKVKIAAVVKANGYGHGCLEMSSELLSMGVDMICVSSINEAIEIRKEHKEAEVLVLGFIPLENLAKAINFDITHTVFSYNQGLALNDAARINDKKVKIHIKIDTGMNRTGFHPDEQSVLKIMELSKLDKLTIQGIYSHLATADEKDKSFAFAQFDLFNKFVRELEEKGLNIPIKHISNSAAVIDLPEMNLDMVRPGIILYGIYPSDEVMKSEIFLKPVMTLKARVNFVKTLKEDGGISYGLTYRGKKGQRIATIPIGYADGYTRLLSNVGEVLIGGIKSKVVGTICMDQCMLDVSMIEGIEVGTEAILFGTNGKEEINVSEVAKRCGKIPYELLCSIGRRVPRVYLRSGKVVKETNYLD
ncbi:MAG: alanine racemase [Eubacteriales bacterium]